MLGNVFISALGQLFALGYLDSDWAESFGPCLQENGNLVKRQIHCFSITRNTLPPCGPLWKLQRFLSTFVGSADVLERLSSVYDTLKTRKTTPFPAGRSLVSGALMSDRASSGKPDLLFFFNLSFLLSHTSSSSFRPHRAPTSNLSHHSISASPVSQGYLHCPFSTTLIIGTFFKNSAPPG